MSAFDFTPTAGPNFTTSNASPTDNIGLDDPTQLERGLRASLYSTDANDAAHEFFKAHAAGDVETARGHGLRAQALMEQAAKFAPRVQSVGDIHGVGDAGDYLAGQLGAAPVGLVKPVAGGLAGAATGAMIGGAKGAAVGGTLGGLGAMYPDMHSAAMMEHFQALNGQTPTQQQAQEALNQGSWQAAAQTLPYAIAPEIGAAGRIVGGKALLPAASGMGKSLVRGAALQAGAGAASNEIGHQFQNVAHPDRDTSHDAMSNLDAAAGNALIAAPFEAAGHAGQGVHGAVDTAGGVGAAAAKAGGKMAMTAAGKGAEAAKEAWNNRPKDLTEAAVMGGEAAAGAVNKAQDAWTRFTQRGKDADVDTLLAPLPKDINQQDWSVANKDKHAAASNVVSKIMSDPEAPEFVKAAAQKYTQSTKIGETWRDLRNAVNDWKKTKDISEGLSDFIAETTDKAAKTASDVVGAKDAFVDAFKGAKNWDSVNRTGRNTEWQVGAAEANPAFNALGKAGNDIPAHGMAKAATVQEALKNLHDMVNGGIDKDRTLHYDSLTSAQGTGATAGGHAYRDGPFIITFRKGLKGQPTSKDIRGVLVNPAHADLIPHIKKMFPHLDVRNYHDVAAAAAAAAGMGESRANAQAPNDPLDPLLAKAIAPHLGLRTPQAQAQTAAVVAQGLKNWVLGGFADASGKIAAPRSLLRMLQSDPINGVKNFIDMMHHDGRIDDVTYAKHKEALKSLQEQVHVNGKLSKLVDDRATNVARAEMSPTARRDLIDHMASGKMTEEQAAAVFGPRAGDVLGDLENLGLHKKPKAQRSEEQHASKEELAQMSNEMEPNEVPESVEHHHYNQAAAEKIDPETGEITPGRMPEPYKKGHKATYKDGNTIDHDAHAAKTIEDLQARNTSAVKKQGYLDYLREKHIGNPDALMREATEFMARKSDEINALPGKGSPDEKMNKAWYVLREEHQGANGEATNIKGDEFNSLNPKTSKWAEFGHDEYGTIAHGRIWLERNNPDGTKSQFATSTAKIIKRMNAARKREGGGTEATSLGGQHKLLMQGLSSLMTAKNADGSPALSGRIGFKDSAKGAIKWAKQGDSLPDNLRMYTKDKKTFGETKAALKVEGDRELVRQAKAQLAHYAGMDKGDSFLANELRTALKNKDIDAVARAMRKVETGREDASFEKELDGKEPMRGDRVTSVDEDIDAGKVRTDEGLDSKALAGQTTGFKPSDETRNNEQEPEGKTNDRLDKGFQRKIREAEERHLKEFERIGLPRETEAHAYEGGSFGNSKNASVIVGKASDGTVYAHIIDAGLREKALNEVLRARDGDEVLSALEKYSIHYAYFDPNDNGRAGSISPAEGTPAFEYHNARGDLEPTKHSWGDGSGKIYKVKNVTRSDMTNLYGLVTAFYKHTGDGSGGKATWERDSGANPGKTGFMHFNNEAAGQTPATEAERKQFFEDVARRLGPQMKAAIEEAGLFSGKNKTPISGEWTQGMIKASAFARNLGQVGAHEAFHEFFDRMKEQPQAAKVLDILNKAANSPYVMRQLERLLDGQMAALKQIKGGENMMEERMAYMFQFHQAGLLKIGPETQTVFQRIANAFRKIAGILNNDQKADSILRAFDKGDMKTPDAAAHVLANNIEARENLYKSVNAALDPALNKLSRLVNTSETNLRKNGMDDVRRMFKRSVGEDGKQGFLDAKDHQMKLKSNQLASIFKDLHPKDLELAAPYLHSGERPTDPKVMRLRALLQGGKVDGEKVEGFLPMMHKYLTDAGVQLWVNDSDGKGHWEAMGHVKNYFPRVMDTTKLVTKPEEFSADLLKHNAAELNKIASEYNESIKAVIGKDADTPKTAEDIAKAITTRMVNGFGNASISENNSAVGFSPFMQAINRRSMDWLHPEVLKKWGEKDVSKILTSYTAQAVKRAEYVRRFGNGGEVLKAKLEGVYDANVERFIKGGMKKADAEAKALKISKDAAKDVMAMEGTLGYNISNGMRRFQNSAMVYENMRVLSTSLFSQFIDPMGMVVRGATMGEAWDAYKRGLREVVASIKDDSHIKDKDSMIADQVGTTDAGGMLAAYGQLYSSQYMGAGFRKANDMLFKYNGMEGFNRGMQVSATRSAINFIKRHVEQPNERSAEYLKELNLTPKDVKVNAQGDLDYTDPKIQQAIHQWVNGSIMRPNAAQRPAWGSDPHYMMFWHMKQFAYTFHDVIMKRAQHEYKKFGDMGPAGVLAAAYTPIMVASDALKSVLLTGSEPIWMKAGLASELEHGAMRAGLMGKFQPLADVALTPGRSILGLGGPLVEQITQLADQTPSEAAINAMPGSNLLNMWGGHHAVEVQGED